MHVVMHLLIYLSEGKADDRVVEIFEGLRSDKSMRVFTGEIYESVREQGYPALGYCKRGGCLLYVYQPQKLLQASSNREKDRNKGSHITEIWTTFFDSGDAEAEGFYFGIGVDRSILVDFLAVYLGYSAHRQLSDYGGQLHDLPESV